MDVLERIKVPEDCFLIVAGAPAGASIAVITLLTRAARHIIAVDRGAESLLAAGILPDELVGDMDSLSAAAFDDLVACGVACVEVPAEKDFTDLELAFDIVRREGSGPVVVCGATGGRIDHQLAVLGACVRAADLGTVIIDEGSVICPLVASVRSHVSLSELGCKMGDTFSVLAMTPGSVVSESGGRYVAEELELDVLSGGGVSNVMVAEGAIVSCHRGSVLVIIPFPV